MIIFKGKIRAYWRESEGARHQRIAKYYRLIKSLLLQLVSWMCLMRIGKIILCGLVVLLMMCVVPVVAYSVKSNGDADNRDKPTMIVEYGTGKDIGLIKVTHIDYAKSESKGKPPQSNTCYKLAKWKWSGPIIYKSAIYVPFEEIGGQPPSPSVLSILNAASEEWDSHTLAFLFADIIYEDGMAGVRDNKNIIGAGDYPQDGVIAVTYTWYNPGTKRAVESDILFDTDFKWSLTGDPLKMDFQNIATHEMGHTLGLSDLYTSSCSDVTMFGYSDYGETTKQTLEQPDITGLQILYGA